MEGAECLVWLLFAGAFALGMRIVWGLANPQPSHYNDDLNDDLDEWDYIAMLDDLEHGDD